MLKFPVSGLLVSVLLISAAAPAARAGDDGFWCGVEADYHFNNSWPEPFASADRASVCAPFSVMIAKGWQRQNLIGENYFDEDSKKLTMSGMNQVHSILLQTQPEHRTIFVQADLSPAVTSTRLDTVQQAVSALLPAGPMPEVLVSNMVPEGRPAQIVSAEMDAYLKSIPPPRLPGGQGASGAASSSGPGASSGGSSAGGSG